MKTWRGGILSAAALCAVAEEVPVSYVAPRDQARAEILWTRPICVETNRYVGWPTVTRLKNGDLGYPSTCLLPDGALLTVYYQQQRPARGEAPCIMATKWKVRERK